MRKLLVFVMLGACSASQDAAPTFIDCGQEAGTVARVDSGQEAGTIARLDGGGLAEAPRGLDAGAGVDACPDALPLAERTADAAKDAAEVPRDFAGAVDATPAPKDGAAVDTTPKVDGRALDVEPLDSGADSELCPPNAVMVEGSCMLCGTIGNFCCKGNACNGGGAVCKAGVCVAS